MTRKNQFDIRFQEPIKNQIYDPPTDELDEYYDFELNFKRFFYEYNHWIVLEIGVEKFELHFYHDILDAFEDNLCQQISLLSAGKNSYIYFNEIQIYFTPTNNKNEVACHVGIIGTGESSLYNLSLSQVVEKMSDFINKVLEIAIQKKYISIQEIPKLVEWNYCDKKEKRSPNSVKDKL